MGRGDINASQYGAQRGSGTTDRDLDLLVMNVLTKKLGLDERSVQDLQALAGQRSEANGAKPKAAVRRSDLSAIGKIPELESRDADGAVSVADFNALRLDVRRIAEALSIIARALK